MCIPGGNSSAKTDRKTQLTEEGNLESIAKSLRDTGAGLTREGIPSIGAGLGDTAKASRYYSDILSGDPAKVAEAVAPEISTVTGQAEQQKKQITNTGNRAGGENATAQDLTTRNRSIIGDIINRARGGAASGLERTGAETSRVGLSETGEGIGATGASASEFATLIQDAIASRQASQKIHDQAAEDFGQVIGTILGGL